MPCKDINYNFTTEVIGNIFIRRIYFEKSGERIEGHRHNFDHCTMVLSGKVLVNLSSESKELIAPSWILVEKDQLHELIALEDNSLCWCVFSHRDFEGGEVIQEYNGNADAYS